MKTTTLSILAALVTHVCFAATPAPIDFGTSARYTPYDPYISPVKQVLTHLNGQTPSMDLVRHLMVEGRNFRYSFTDPYTAARPEVTAATHAGDCKAKALWLASQLNDPSVRFVIGRAHSSSKVSHAWLMWQSEGHWWILDCTLNSAPIAADHINPTREYIPQYSFTRNGSYRHGGMAVASNNSRTGTAAVANN